MKKSSQVIEQKVDNETLVIPIIDGIAQMKQVSCLSQSGTIIWDMLSTEKDMTEDNIISAVALHYKMVEDDIREDVLEFIQMMKAQNIVI